MTTATLDQGHVTVGDRVVLVRSNAVYRYNTNDRRELPAGTRFEVTRVYANSVLAKTLEFFAVRDTRNYYIQRTVERRISFQIDRTELALDNGDFTPPPPPRKLGEAPKGDGIVGIDNPGIQWLFEDMGKFAEQQGYCDQYDALCAKLGIPGRPRDFEVSEFVSGIAVRATIKARNLNEARQKFRAALTKTSDAGSEEQEGAEDE